MADEIGANKPCYQRYHRQMQPHSTVDLQQLTARGRGWEDLWIRVYALRDVCNAILIVLELNPAFALLNFVFLIFIKNLAIILIYWYNYL